MGAHLPSGAAASVTFFRTSPSGAPGAASMSFTCVSATTAAMIARAQRWQTRRANSATAAAWMAGEKAKNITLY